MVDAVILEFVWSTVARLVVRGREFTTEDPAVSPKGTISVY